MKKGWELKRLDEVAERIEDIPHLMPKAVHEGNKKFISTKDFTEHGIDYSRCKRISEGDFQKLAKKIQPRRNDILFSRIGTIGEARLVDTDEDFIASYSIVTIRANSSFLIPNFLLYALQSPSILDQARKGVRSVAMPDLGVKIIKAFQLPVPPLPEQQRIVSVLDETFASIAQAKSNAERNLVNARELFEVVLQNEFEKAVNVSELKKLGEACSFSQGIQVDVKNQNEQKKDNQVRFLRIIDFTQGNEPPRYIDNPGEKYIIKSDDVSLVRYGATTGFVCSGLEGALANNLFRVIPESNKISKEFLYWFLRSPVFQNEIAPSINGVAMPAISFGLIHDIKFPIPPLAEQRAIVGRLEALSAETGRLEEIYQQKVESLEELKKSVLGKAFAGEL